MTQDLQPMRNPERVERMQKCMFQMKHCDDFQGNYPTILGRSMHPYGAYYGERELLGRHLDHAQMIHERSFQDFEHFAEQATAEL